jgi:hypothetical protein
MLIKRHYKKPEGWEKRTNDPLLNGTLMIPSLPAGECINPPPLDYVELKHTGANPEQNFSMGMVVDGLREGWMAFDGDELVLQVKPETLLYKVLRTPGRYCLVCRENLNDNSEGGEAAREHVKAKHAGAPLGSYERINHYECVLDADQHKKYKGGE